MDTSNNLNTLLDPSKGWLHAQEQLDAIIDEYEYRFSVLSDFISDLTDKNNEKIWAIMEGKIIRGLPKKHSNGVE